MTLRAPALTERREDIPLLASLFLRRAAPRASLAEEGKTWLSERDWRGNVRELRSVMEVAGALTGPGSTVVDADLLRFAAGEADETVSPPTPAQGGSALDAAIAELETRMLRDAMAASGRNQSEAARRLGISRVGLMKKLTRLGLK